MAYTISTHNGSNIARQHNLRNKKVISKESHIDKNREHETWYDIKPQEAYSKIFGEAIKEYNQKQISAGHYERKIKNYYKKIKEDPKKHTAYEMIVSIGSCNNHPDADISKEILKEFFNTWSERNPNLVIIGAYYHNDEQTPHLHLDYVPVGTNMSRGMKCQNSLTQALKEQGFITTKSNFTAQMQWEKVQNNALEQICNKHGLEIEHPEKEKQKHMNIKAFRQKMQIEELEKKKQALQKQCNNLIDKNNSLIEYHNNLNRSIDALEQGASELAHKIVDREHEIGRDWAI